MNSSTQRAELQTRTAPTAYSVNQGAENELIIEGYFIVFNSLYTMGDDMSESISPGSVSNLIGGDIRALIDHNSEKVLGRTTAHTLTLREDDVGLWGRIVVNPKDTDATNCHARVARGDVSQCSIGFRILDEETEIRDDGSIHWTIKKLELFEVSVCTFPAYEDTGVQARANQKDAIIERANMAWRENMRQKLKGGQ